MRHICANCNICSFMPEQVAPRELSLEDWDERPIVLVIDDCQSRLDQENGYQFMREGMIDMPFSYTSTLRCEYDVAEISGEEFKEAVNKCSVWTHQLLEDRAVVITTETGAHQIGLGEKKRGDMFKSGRLGVVLVIPPVALLMTSTALRTEYKPRIQRVLKEVRVVKSE